ncbi:pilus assembly protein [Desulfatitalea alkaliphila]|uniref:PQQ-binding-like beta-propeller repeat protein n=1 Tax=Desulfatitalea alkaliphila TaxID=2929485 RepID=A0AA41R2Q2_9BACT|nr:PilC/PilY family type IV pilus protein [Desulfatitalea alkaliphila]MCJ8501932.1 PQQ-binding-like beta-propeller repeat protein [Desulfatitalea alkaliphila]
MRVRLFGVGSFWVTVVLLWGLPALAVELSDVPLDGVAGSTATEGMVSGQALSEDGETVFQTRYWPGTWHGDVLAFAGNPVTGQVDTDPGKAIWRASDGFQQVGVDYETRRVVTYGGIWPTPQGAPFRYDQLSEDQKRLLGWDGVADSEAAQNVRDLVDYLRGATMDTMDGWRDRRGVLGDMVNSAPVVAGNTLFVGANDGMLHAFDIRTGHERFAYVPHQVFGHLKALAAPDYADDHRFYVDGPLSVGEVVVDTDQRMTYLVGGLGKGGRGYFCLRIGDRRRQVTEDEYGVYEPVFHVDAIANDWDEEHIAEVVRWSYPPPLPSDHGTTGGGQEWVAIPPMVVADADMGYSYGQAYAVNANAPEGLHRPVVIFGNGYNSPNGRAVLYVLDAADGTLIRKIDTGAGIDNGLSTPALVDVNLDRRVDYVYAGDLRGNLWKFDLTDENPEHWGMAHGAAARGDQGRSVPLFRAVGQPITARPDVMAVHGGCLPGASGGYLVVFGTGRFLGLSDRKDRRQQSLYGIWDAGTAMEPLGWLRRRHDGRLSGGRQLIRREVVANDATDDGAARRLSGWSMDMAAAAAAGRSNRDSDEKPTLPVVAGWFFDFPVPTPSQAYAAERVVEAVAIRGGKAVVASLVPSRSPDTQPDYTWLNILHMCGGDMTENECTADAMLSSRRFEGRLKRLPTILKTAADPRLDWVILHDAAGRLIRLPFQGEIWGRTFWRQDGR